MTANSIYLLLLFCLISCQTKSDHSTALETDKIGLSENSFESTSMPLDSTALEITQTDITLHPDSSSASFSVFGIRLEMDREMAQNIMNQNKDLYFYVDKGHSTADFRIYLYDTHEDGSKKDALLYLIWTDNMEGLTRITFYQDMEPYLMGDTKKLLTKETLDPDSEIRNYLGSPNASAVTLDVPAINLKHTTYYFFEKGMEVTKKFSDGKVSVVFAITSDDTRPTME